jgi:hypothetical protein
VPSVRENPESPPRLLERAKSVGDLEQDPCPQFDGCLVRSSSVNLFEHEHRDLPVGLRLVRRVIGPCFDRALPPEPLLVARDLARDVVAFGRTVLQLDLRFFFRLWYQTGCFGAPPSDAATA